MWAASDASREREDYDTLLVHEEEGGVRAEGLPEGVQSWRQRRIAGTVLGLACAAVLVLAWPRIAGSPSAVSERLATELVVLAGGCVGQGADCRASHCCLNGGDEGLQCYARDANWAQCASSCEPGVHEEDKPTLDVYGKLAKPAWSCKKLGQRSQPACASFGNRSTCPSSRCSWKEINKCLEPCGNFGNTTCSAQDQCTWNGTSCLDACWTLASKDSCLSDEHKKRCEWKDDKCAQACWTYGSSDMCWKGNKCIWEGTCKPDPCSAPGEDCRETKCCSGLRGGGGATCFEQNEYYATCAKHCDDEDWTCKKLGNRTKTQTRCTWAGESCASTGMCCNKGFQCAVKDDYFTGCVQTFKQMSFKKVNMPMPPGWPAHPKVIGGGQFEYAMQPAPPGKGMGTTLYCFMAYLPGSYEERLMEIARASSASIFACDEHDLFHTWQSQSVTWDSKATTLSNIDVFVDVWNNVEKAGKLWKYDWTVKVDPDCLIVPQRLKWHLGALNAPSKQPIYVKNNNLNASIGNSGFLGAVEIFSREALELYFDWWPKCQKTMGLDGGEDGFMKGCMDALGVGYMVDGGMFKPDNNPALCKDGTKAAYHPLKIQENYQCCVEEVNGHPHTFEWGKCTDLSSSWVGKVWPDCADGKCRQPVWR